MLLHKFRFKPALLVTAMAAATAVQAEDDHKKNLANPEIEMIEVVGVATAGLDVAIDQTELEKLQASDLADVFRNTPEVSAGGGIAAGQKIYVRGIGEELLNITVDGAEQASAIFHHAGRVLIEPELLKRVDVEAGAGSATAGPGALGGSVRFTTKDPVDLLKADESFGALIKSSFEENGSANKNNLTVFGKAGVFSAMANMVTLDQDTVEDGNGNNVVGSELNVDLGYVKLVADINEANYLAVSYEKLEHEGESLFKPEWEPNGGNQLADQVSSRETTTLNYNFNPSDSDLIDFSINLYETENLQRRSNVGSALASKTDGVIETTGLTVQNTSRVGSHELIYGSNYRDDTSSIQVLEGLASAFGRSEESGKVLGFYLQDIYSVNEQLTLSGGARYDDYEFSFPGLTAIPNLRPPATAKKIEQDGVSLNAGANYQLTSALGVSASYGQALRGPKVFDSYRIGSIDHSEDLKAEKADNLELGVNFEEGGLAFSATAYRSEIADPIALVNKGAAMLPVRENIDGDIVTNGYTLKLGYTIDALQLGAKFNSYKGKIDSSDPERDGQRASRSVYGAAAAVIGDTLVLNADYAFSDKLSAGWSSEVVAGVNEYEVRFSATSAATIKKPGYSTHDLYVHWEPLSDDRLLLALNAKNVFDKAYRSHAGADDLLAAGPAFAGIAAPKSPGRNVSLTATLRF